MAMPGYLIALGLRALVIAAVGFISVISGSWVRSAATGGAAQTGGRRRECLPPTGPEMTQPSCRAAKMGADLAR